MGSLGKLGAQLRTRLILAGGAGDALVLRRRLVAPAAATKSTAATNSTTAVTKPGPEIHPDKGNHPDGQPRTPWRGRLVVLAGLVLAGLNGRIMVAVVAPIIGLITADVPLTSTHEEIIGLAAPLSFAVIGAVSPLLGRRFGLEVMMVVALAISAAGELGRSLVSTPLGFIGWTVAALAGAGIGNVIAPPLIKKYFPDRLSVVTSAYTFFTTISTALPPLFVFGLATNLGWRFSVGVWALIGAAAIVPWVPVLVRSRRGKMPATTGKTPAVPTQPTNNRQTPHSSSGESGDPRTGTGMNLLCDDGPTENPTGIAQPRDDETDLTQEAHGDTVPTQPDRRTRPAVPLWKTKVAWAITLAFTGNSVISYTMYTWFPHVLRDAGIAAPTAATYLAIFTAGSLPGALIVPMLVTRVRRTWIFPIVFFCGYAVSFTALAIKPGFLPLLWILLSRLGDCFYPYAYSLINLRTRTTHGSIAMSGFVQPVSYIIATIGPPGFGILHTLSGNWHVPMFAVVAILPFMLVGGLVAARAKPLDV